VHIQRGKGAAIAVNNKGKNETFMKMLELQAGLGLGVNEIPGSLRVR
jgi:hypothetical protein